MKEFEIEVSKTVLDYFIAESEDEAIDMAMQKFENEPVEIYKMDEKDLDENKPCSPVVNEFNKDSLAKMTDEELENLVTALHEQIDTISAVRKARLEKTVEETIQAFNEAVKRIFDFNLTITAYNEDGECFDIFDAESLEVIR